MAVKPAFSRLCATTYPTSASPTGATMGRSDADAEFIMAAREAVPALIEEVERLQSVLGKARVRWRCAECGIDGATANERRECRRSPGSA
jgi:hypothetical protein